MKAYWGSGSIAPLVLHLGTKLLSVVSFTPRSLYSQGKSPWYKMDRRLDGLQNRSGCGGEEKNSQPLLGLEPQIIQPVAQRYTTELSRILFRDNLFVITCSHYMNKAVSSPTCDAVHL
jgi:hypothetical protein